MIILVLQYHIWFDQEGLKEFRLTEQRLTQMENLSHRLQIRNNALRAEIDLSLIHISEPTRPY